MKRFRNRLVWLFMWDFRNRLDGQKKDMEVRGIDLWNMIASVFILCHGCQKIIDGICPDSRNDARWQKDVHGIAMKIGIVRRCVQRIRELDRHFFIIVMPLRIYRVKSMVDTALTFLVSVVQLNAICFFTQSISLLNQ